MKILWMVSAAAVLAGCASHVAKAEIQAVNPQLAAALAAPAEALAQRRAPLQAGTTTVSSCAQYLDIAVTDRAGEEVQMQPAAADYLLCDTLQALENASLAKRGEAAFGAALYERFDLGSIPSSFGPRLTSEARTLEQLAAVEPQVTRHGVGLDSSEWHFAMELVAVADLNRNGDADWLLWMADEAKDGNYRVYQLIVVWDPVRQSGLLAGEAWPW